MKKNRKEKYVRDLFIVSMSAVLLCSNGTSIQAETYADKTQSVESNTEAPEQADVTAKSTEEKTAAQKKAKRAFKKFLGKSKVNWGGNKYPQSSFSFCYTTIGEDDTPILLVNCDASCHAEGYAGVYQYIDGKVKRMVALDWIDGIYKEGGVVALGHSGGGYGERNVFYYKLNSENVLEECAYSAVLYKEDWGQDYKDLRKMFGKDQYQIEGKSVTKKKFNSYMDEIKKESENTLEELKMHANKASTRKKYL